MTCKERKRKGERETERWGKVSGGETERNEEISSEAKTSGVRGRHKETKDSQRRVSPGSEGKERWGQR